MADLIRWILLAAFLAIPFVCSADTQREAFVVEILSFQENRAVSRSELE